MARVFTGAAEAQINFTSLVIDQHLVNSSSADHASLLHKAVVKNSENASSIPEKHHTYATYKKYLTPDSAFSVELDVHAREKVSASSIEFVDSDHPKLSTLLPLANSPPADVAHVSSTHTFNVVVFDAWERDIEEIAINNSIGGISRL